ncbi:MAG: phosphatidylserine decarboxylase family protein [Bacteroidales bacterium OttesenSCG-928-I14]|jgi:phosphatidylserine decarboxylase|nr:phosphatidylserine decarboxylase family protein [Bacteroidales bacterium OttesenSCG-928-I14]
MKIHKEGHNIIINVFFLLILLNIGYYLLNSISFNIYINLFIHIGSICIFFIIVNFFRSPTRIFIGDSENIIVSPADGKILDIKKIFEHEFSEKKIQISIFMGLSDVHVNWIPINGKIIQYKHKNGKYKAAYLPKSSIYNERSTIVIETHNGEHILIRQIAGALAKRIVTYAKINQKCQINDQLGFIKFGSRVDLLLPLTAKILVNIDQKVIGNSTIIAYLK